MTFMKDSKHAGAGYGKDYCAALFNADPSLRPSPKYASGAWHKLPYSDFLRSWASSTRASGGGDAQDLTARGLYEGETVLYFAVSNRDLRTVRLLLSHCADDDFR